MSGVLAALCGAGGGPMPTFGAAGAGNAEESDAGGSTTIAYPSGIAAGDTLILHCMAYDGISTPTINTPAGWLVAANDLSVDLLVRVCVFYKEATGAESGNLTVTHTGIALFAGRMYRYNGGSGVEDVSSSRVDGSGTGWAAEDVTTLGINRQAIQLLFALGITTVGNMTGESGADYTEAVAEYSYNGAGGLDATFGIQDADVPTATAITGGSVTLGSSVPYRFKCGFAIKP